MLAARAALRVLPFVQEALRYKPNDIVFPVFRALAFTWVAARYFYPEKGHAAPPIDVGQFGLASRAATNAADAAQAARGTVSNPSLAAGVFNFASDAVRDFARETSASAISEIRNPSPNKFSGYRLRVPMPPFDTPEFFQWEKARQMEEQSTAAFYAQFDPTFWSAVSSDATLMEQGRTAPDIAGSQLWADDHQPDPLRWLWREMQAALLAAKQDWEVWTNWYDDRLAGRVRDAERELAYVLIDDALWTQGPAIVNAEIKRRIEELEPYSPPIEVIPEQEPNATRFGVNTDGVIDVVPDPLAPETVADALQREYYDELRFKAQALIELGPNQLGDLSGSAERFREALKERIEEISITSLWSRGNTLRSRLKAHDLSMSNGEPDPARLNSLVAETLRDLVHTWNVFIVGDPKGRELDEIRLGPQELQAAKQVVAAAGPIIEALQHSENVATPTVIETIAEQVETATTASPGIDGDQAIGLAQKSTGNFVAELLRSVIQGESAIAWKEYRAGIYRAAGTATAGGIGLAVYNWPATISFVARNADVLKEFVIATWHNPTLIEIIDWVVRISI